MKLTALSIFVALLFATTSADAENPKFATLDRVGTSSNFSADLGLTFFDNDFSDATGINLRLHTDYFFNRGTGLYGTLPISYLMLDEVDDESDVGNLEVGAMFLPRMGSQTSLILRAGLALPTATDGGATFLNAFGQLSDYVLHFPDVMSLRFSASLLSRNRGSFFWRLDGGLDVPFDTADDGEPQTDIDPLLRFNVGAGVRTGGAALMIELANLGTTGDVVDSEDRFIHSLGFSARFTSSAVQPMVALVVPVDDELRELVNFTLFVGISAPLNAGAR